MISTHPAGIPETDWLATPASVRTLVLAQQQEIQALRQENDELRGQLTALATELASLRERIGRSSRNSSKPPSSEGQGFRPAERRKGSGRKRGGQPGHPGSGPELLPIERVDAVVEHHPDACQHCGSLPAEVEGSHYGPRLRALVGRLCGAFPLEFQQDLGAGVSPSAAGGLRRRDRRPTGNADSNNPNGKRGWHWGKVTALVTMFFQGLCRSTAAAIELIGSSFGGIVVSDRFSAYNHLPTEQRHSAGNSQLYQVVEVHLSPVASKQCRTGIHASPELRLTASVFRFSICTPTLVLLHLSKSAAIAWQAACAMPASNRCQKQIDAPQRQSGTAAHGPRLRQQPKAG